MELKHKYLAAVLALSTASFAQVGIGTTTPAGALDITSTTNGVLVPRIALTSKLVSAPVVNPQTGALVNGTLVWNTATAGTAPNNVIPGFYYWNGSWTALTPTVTNDWSITGNAGTVAGTNYIGTTDAQDIRFRTAATDKFNIHNTSGQLSAYNLGTVTTPTYSWNADLNTGMYSSGADAIAFATNGTQRLRMLANGQVVINNTAAPIAGDQFAVYSTASAINAYTSGTFGVYTQTTGANAYGIYSATNGAGSYGSYSASTGNNGIGSYAYSTSATGFGSWASNTNTTGTASAGAGNNQAPWYLNAGSGGAFTGSTTGVFGRFTTAGTGQGAIFQDNFSAQWNVGYWSGAQYYKIIGNGSVSTVVKGLDGNKVVMHCTETPENLFEDYGQGQLINGRAHITIDPVFSKNIVVDENHPIKIFIQPEGECNGVFVTNKSAGSFDVVELRSGNSNIRFSYSIVANRANETYTLPNGELRIANYDQRFEKAPVYQQTSNLKASTVKEK